jgi:pimeloyl-ACP methyl ester carboxylesterase
METFHTADGAELSYTEHGSRGDLPLLFLHGWNAASEVWEPIVERLAQNHRTIALDLRGFGSSNKAPGPFRVETFADDLSALLMAAELDPLVVVGHSMGAAVAQRFAIDRPDAVEGLVLIAPVPAGGYDVSPKLDAMFRTLPGNPEAISAWLSRLTYREPPPEVRKLLRDVASRVAPEVALESYESWSTLDFADEAATIATPTLVVAPERDRPEFAREKVADLIDGSDFEVLREAGHYAILEQPERIARHIERFVAKL